MNAAATSPSMGAAMTRVAPTIGAAPATGAAVVSGGKEGLVHEAIWGRSEAKPRCRTG